MSQVLEFRGIAVKYGPALLREHMKNYFSATGRLMDEVAWKSLSARLNKALKPGEILGDLAGSVVLPNPHLGGQRAEWTLHLDLPEGDEATDEKPEFALSTDVASLKALVTQSKPEFALASTMGLVEKAIERIATGSRVAQRELTGGISALEFERRTKAVDTDMAQREAQRLNEQNLQQAKLIELLSNLLGRETDANGTRRQLVLSTGRSTRRPTKDEDTTE